MSGLSPLLCKQTGLMVVSSANLLTGLELCVCEQGAQQGGTLAVRAVFDMSSPLTGRVKAELFQSHRPAEGWIILRAARPAGLQPDSDYSILPQPGPVTYIWQLFTSFLFPSMQQKTKTCYSKTVNAKST